MIKGKPPLTDSDYADVRTSVLQTITARERRKTWALRSLQLGFATLAIAFVTIWLTRTPSTDETLSHPKIAQTSNPTTQQADASTERPGNAFTQQPSNPATQQPPLASSPNRHAAHVARRRSHHLAAATRVASAAPLRIELATNDPDIRIIWITNPNESR
jgi:hypothetical protein